MIAVETKTLLAILLKESLDAQSAVLALYRELLENSRDRLVALEENARKMIAAEELHAGEVDKMLRKPGETASYRSV